MLAERDSTLSAASSMVAPLPLATLAMNSNAPSVRERRPSRGSEEREARIRRDLTCAADNNNARRSSSGRSGDEERRGVRERSRRRERGRRERLDRLESLDCDHPLQELDPFMTKVGVNQRVKVNLKVYTPFIPLPAPTTDFCDQLRTRGKRLVGLF